ncbi:MAG: phytanoyl-CoA dioxygenase family protein [Cyanobacteria bacterium P01_A01_bin.105]
MQNLSPPARQDYPPVTPSQVDQFQQQGYLILENVLSAAQIERIVGRFEPLFDTQFETGIYPDEWYGRPGLSQPNATRQMTGLWRCDRTLASFTLSSAIARLNASLMGWPAARYGFDACWLKPPDAPPVSFHRNSTYVASLDPASVVTCWIALSHATSDAGTLQIVPGSHHWASADNIRFLHAPREDYRAPLWQAATAAGVDAPQIQTIELSPGSAICFHGQLWHGSDRNQTTHQTRRSLAVSTLHPQAKFQPHSDQGFIFSRYRRLETLEMDESYFPILWSQDGYRTPFLADYCGDALAP